MQTQKDIYVCSVTFSPRDLCIFAESLFAWYMGVSSRPKHMEVEAKIVIYSALVLC